MEEKLNILIDQYFDDMTDTIRELVGVDSCIDESSIAPGAPFGIKIKECLDYTLGKGCEFGFKTKNLDGYAGVIQMGEDEAETVAILAHLDIVPAGDGWSYPPFEAKIIDGKMYGRGTEDDKGPLVACLYGMKAIKESGLPISKKTHLICGTDEETGGRCIKHYLKKEGQFAYGFSPDALFPIVHAEKGIVRFVYRKKMDFGASIVKHIASGSKFNVIPNQAVAWVDKNVADKAKHLLQQSAFAADIDLTEDEDALIITAKGISAHAMSPEDGKNALQILIAFLADFPAANDPVLEDIRYLHSIFALETDGKSMGIAASDEVSGELTVNLACFSTENNLSELKFDIRYPVTHSWDVLNSGLATAAENGGFSYELVQHKAPLYVEKDTPFLKLMRTAYEETTGKEAAMLSMGGGTYCRYVKNAVSYGPVFPGHRLLAHQADEYICLDQLREMAKIYVQTLYQLIK